MYSNYNYYPQQTQQSQTQSYQNPQINPIYQQNYLRQAPPQVTLKGRLVSSLEEARATSIDFDGSIFYFPDLANKRIYTKQINLDGTVLLNMYELKEIPAAQEMTATYKVTGTVQAWGKTIGSSDTAAAKYGNLILAQGDELIVVYGTTATTSALSFNKTTGKYTYTNAQDFLTNAVTKDIKLRDTVELLVVRTNFSGTPQLNAIVLNVIPYEYTDEEKAEIDIEEVNGYQNITVTEQEGTYNLDVITIPTNKPLIRKDNDVKQGYYYDMVKNFKEFDFDKDFI